MSPRHHGVAAALRRAAEIVELADDAPPHIAFVVTVNGIDPPEVIVCDSDDRAANLRDYRFSDGGEGGGEPLWTPADFQDAMSMMRDIDMAMRMWSYRRDVHPVDHARSMWRDERERRFSRQMEHEATLAAYPVVCSCGERFRTARGAAQHARARGERHKVEGTEP